MEIFLTIFLLSLALGLAYTIRHQEKKYTKNEFRPRKDDQPNLFDKKLEEASQKFQAKSRSPED